MNFNYLMEKNTRSRKCRQYPGQECYWQPVGDGRATNGGYVCVMMCCKHCDRREDVFLPEAQYKIQEKLISKEIGYV